MWNRVLIGIEKKKKSAVHKKGCVRKTKIYLIIKNDSTLWEIINFLTQSIFKASLKESTWKLEKKGIIIGFYPSSFVYSRLSSKIRFLYCFLGSVAPCGGPMIDTEWNFFFKFRPANCQKMHFSRIFIGNLEFYGDIWKGSWLERYIELSFLCVCMYLNQNVRGIGE